MEHILIVDDDIHIGNMLEEVLGKEGYFVSRAYSGTEALLVLKEKIPDLVLLDLMLPGLSGEEVIGQLIDIPVIVVSAKVDVDSKVGLLLSGAADYVTKPFDVRELLARIRVVLHGGKSRQEKYFRQECAEGKVSRAQQEPGFLTETFLLFEELRLDTETKTVFVSGSEVHLTRTEYAILKLLMQNPSRVIAKSVLLDRIAGDTPDCTESSLKMHISNLRKKLRAVDGKDYIEAVWGIGFKLKNG